ncbi:hypothetical protein B7P43_G17468 [Cryptotermes secundus]|uniref:Uncharacterized protein n=1 Tax=Cryptotermes secundus TaxID=105785 RepID=A0A2J7R4B0_9NEOP|nr:uncharacterized protein LOC111863471 isoform X3 [Cryptotermes secundus]PNF35670.1 hypothetical protein B7P43_G17468 [Cryptotermes secundus]
MWFCCQIWQCNFKTCLGPLEIWKTWNGWSHVVYPSKGNTASKTFTDSRGTRGRGQATVRSLNRGTQSRDIPRNPVYDAISTSDPRRTGTVIQEVRSRDNAEEAASERPLQTASERTPFYYGSSHSLGSKEFPHLNSEFRVPDIDGEGSSSASAGRFLPQEKVNSDGAAISLALPLSSAERDRLSSYPEDVHLHEFCSMGLQHQRGSQFFRLDLAPDTLVQDEPRTVESSAQMSLRTPSTDLTELEQSLEYWHQQHSRQNYNCMTHAEDEPHSTVRYNDTGSLEEVNHEYQVDYIVHGGDESRYFSCGKSAQYQYRQLWSLRAMLAKNEYLLSQSVLNKETVASTLRTAASFKRSQSSVEIYPGSAVEVAGAVSYSSEEISHTTRRQMYVTAANSRMECTEVHSVYQFDNLSFDGSNESFDTIDNEGYSTDTSFIDQHQNYGIDGSNDRQAHRLQQLRADSGYRSLENPPAPNLVTHQQSLDMAARLSPLVHSPDADYHFEFPVCYNTSCHSQGGDSSIKHRHSLEGVDEVMARDYNTSMPQYCHEPDEGVAGLHSPPAIVTDIEYGSWERCQRKNHRSASRKRHEYVVSGGRHSLTHLVTDPEYSRSQFFQNVGATYPRDYSIDEKSDALFREFSRCDPVKTRPCNSHRQQLIHSFPYSFWDQKKKLLEPQDSDEERLPQDPLLLDVTTDSSTVSLIKLDDHSEENYGDNVGDDFEDDYADND